VDGRVGADGTCCVGEARGGEPAHADRSEKASAPTEIRRTYPLASLIEVFTADPRACAAATHDGDSQ
jgi:hypothetical protein